MNTIPYILKEFKAFTPQTKISAIKDFFTETTFTHFPIVENGTLLGLISEADAEALDDSQKSIDQFQYLYTFFYTKENTNLLEIIPCFSSNDANILPVLDAKNKYLGYYDLIDVLHSFNNTPFIKSEGTFLIIEKEERDYSFSEVCQIVETNNGKVMGVFVSETNATFVKIILKITTQNINEIIQTFRRYKYNVLSKHYEDNYLEDLKNRSNYLQKYLNI